MLIGYARPQNVTWALASDGAGQAWMTDTSALDDGRPARVTRLRWRADPAVAGQTVSLLGTWDAGMPIRVVGLLGLAGLPVGTLIELRGRASGADVDLGLAAQPVFSLADASLAAWFVVPRTAPMLDGIELRISNGDGDQVAVPAGALVDIGELAIFSAVDVPISSGWTVGIVDTTVRARTLGAQVNEVARRTYRQLQTPIAPARGAAVRGGGLDNGMDWERMVAAVLPAGARTVAIPRWGKDGQVDLLAMHRTAVFGKASAAGAIGHQGGDYYAASWTFDEIPPQ